MSRPLERPGRVDEISESAAVGVTAAIFEDIKQCLQVPVVNLIYRHLATVPAGLEWGWCSVRPAVLDGRIALAAHHLTSRAAATSSDVDVSAAAAAMSDDARVVLQIKQVVAAYNRANPQNLVIATCLLELLGSSAPGHDAPRADFAAIAPAPRDPMPTQILPAMVDPAQLPTAVLDRIALFTDQQERSMGFIVPSLYRHLAHWPDFLSAALRAFTSAGAIDVITSAARQVERDAQSHAQALVDNAPSIPLLQQPDPGVRRQVEQQLMPFARGAIAKMIVAGACLARAVDAREAAPERP